jgi:hypothetical protein
MENINHKISCAEAREIDIVDYLSSLGYEPANKSRQNYWYLSPFRTEKTASFKVDRTLNRWYDHGVGKGGSLIDLVMQLYQCSIQECLEKLASPGLPISTEQKPLFISPKEKNTIRILSVHLISSYHLVRYLDTRRITPTIADRYCQEVRYQVGDKIFYALGFKNDAGGYELRSERFKGSSSPKAITCINLGAKNLAVFEGFFDFLSWLVLYEKQDVPPMNFCILNSLAFFEKAGPFLEQHAIIHLYLDNDTAGQNCSQYARGIHPAYQDESHLFAQYKDLNEWLVTMGKRQQPRQ